MRHDPCFRLPLLLQAHAALPVHESSLTASLLTACTDLRFVMWSATSGGRRARLALIRGLLDSFRSAVAVTSALLASFEAYNDVCGYTRAPAYHLLRGAPIDPSVRRVELAGKAAPPSEGGSGSGGGSGRASSARDVLRAHAPGRLVVSDDMFSRIRAAGVRQLLVMGSLVLDIG